VQVLVNLGVYRNVENLTDKEMISEYEKLKKQSRKLQKRIKKQQKIRNDNSQNNERRSTEGS
jgi:hypothetical protein